MLEKKIIYFVKIIISYLCIFFFIFTKHVFFINNMTFGSKTPKFQPFISKNHVNKS
jgi:hypothetical protein